MSDSEAGDFDIDGWDYRLALDPSGEELVLVEAYFDGDGHVVGWCDASLGGSDVAETLRRVKEAATFPVVDPADLRAATPIRHGEPPDRRRGIPGPHVDDDVRQVIESIWRRPLSDDERARVGPALAVFETFMVFVQSTGRFEPRWNSVDAGAVLAILDDVIQGEDEE